MPQTVGGQIQEGVWLITWSCMTVVEDRCNVQYHGGIEEMKRVYLARCCVHNIHRQDSERKPMDLIGMYLYTVVTVLRNQLTQLISLHVGWS